MGLFLTASADPTAASANTFIIILIYVVLFGFLYFVMIRPQRKEQKKSSGLRVGDQEFGGTGKA